MDYKLIMALLAVIVVGFFGYQWFTRKTVEKMQTPEPVAPVATVAPVAPVATAQPSVAETPQEQEGPAQFGETLRHPEKSYRQMSEGPPPQFAQPETSSGSELEPQSMFAYDEYAPSSGVPF
jgi:hypothetical protein